MQTNAANKGTTHHYQEIKGKEELREAKMIKGGVVSVTTPFCLYVYVVLLQRCITCCSYCRIIKNHKLIATLEKAVATYYNYYPSTAM
jgi:hypothetical protein